MYIVGSSKTFVKQANKSGVVVKEGLKEAVAYNLSQRKWTDE